MNYEISGPYSAEQLFRLEQHTKVGITVPAFANLKAVALANKSGEKFTGTGIYGVLLRNRLAYVGILTGNKNTLFSGSVVQERWRKHLTYFSLRSPECAASPSNIRRILSEISAPPIDALSALLGAPDVSIEECQQRRIGFTLGASTQFNKVRFATENWDIFAPGNESEMLREVSFVYARFLPSTRAYVDGVPEPLAYQFVKRDWLETREKRLYQRFQPICNSHTSAPNRSVDTQTFLDALAEQMALPLTPYLDYADRAA